MILGLLGVAAITGTGTEPPGDRVPSPVHASAPPHGIEQTGACAKVLAQLPVELGRLAPRVVHTTPDSPNVVAWGDPAVVLACGAARPKALHPGSDEQVFNAGDLAGPYYMVSRSGNANVYTIIDRAPYVAITVPAKYRAAEILPALVGAVGKALPPVCTTEASAPDPGKLCTRRPT